jgi:hypothetical protein
MKLEHANVVARLAPLQVNTTRSPTTVRWRQSVKAAIRRRPDRTLTILVQRIDAPGTFIVA